MLTIEQIRLKNQHRDQIWRHKVVSILNALKNSILNFYLNHETIPKLTKKYQSQILDKVLPKYLYKLKIEIRKIWYILYQHSKITKNFATI